MTFTYLAKVLCDTPLVILTNFTIYPLFLYIVPTPSVYAHPIFNCEVDSLTCYVIVIVIP